MRRGAAAAGAAPGYAWLWRRWMYVSLARRVGLGGARGGSLRCSVRLRRL